MSLKPAVRHNGKIYAGQTDDSHLTIKERHGIDNENDADHGFIDNSAPKRFLTRKNAIHWLKRTEPKVYHKIARKLPPEGLHSHIYAAAKGIVQKLSKEERGDEIEVQGGAVDLSDKTAIIYDRGGLYLYCAEKLAEKYKKVMYYLADADAYPSSQKHTIGEGLKGITRVHDFWRHVDEADIVYLFDCYDGELQHWLRSKGYTVYGTGRAEQLEIDKIMFLDKLKEVGLPCPKTYIAKGLKDLREYLKSHDGETLFLKNLHRGDFESKKFTSMAQIRPWLDDLVKRVGTASDTMEVLVQHKIDALAEVGYDGFCVDGEYTANCIIGYEDKDTAFAGKVFAETPEIVGQVNEAFAPLQKKLGGRGNLSTEIRVTADGTAYYIDPTERVPSPPGEIMCEVYENWAEATWQIAHGIVPELEPKAPFVAELVLTSAWYDCHELHVSFPTEHRQHIKLKNHKMRDGEFYCVPNGNGEFFGAVVAWGKTLDEAMDKVKEVAESIEADEFKFDPSCFDNIGKSIEAGEKFGVMF